MGIDLQFAIVRASALRIECASACACIYVNVNVKNVNINFLVIIYSRRSTKEEEEGPMEKKNIS